jgi:hypothetical protein
MTNPSPYSVQIRLHNGRGGRYRWDVYEAGKLRDSSMHNFATRGAARVDADGFIEKLVETWRRGES